MSAEIRNWLRDMKAQEGSLPAHIVPPEFIPALSIEELMGVPLAASVEFEAGKLDETVEAVRATQEEEHAQWLAAQEAARITPEQALAQCTEMGDAQYQAYMAALQSSDPEFFAQVLLLVDASRAEVQPENGASPADSAAEAGDADADDDADEEDEEDEEDEDASDEATTENTDSAATDPSLAAKPTTTKSSKANRRKNKK